MEPRGELEITREGSRHQKEAALPVPQKEELMAKLTGAKDGGKGRLRQDGVGGGAEAKVTLPVRSAIRPTVSEFLSLVQWRGSKSESLSKSGEGEPADETQ